MEVYDVSLALKETSKGRLRYSNSLDLEDVFLYSNDCAGVVTRHNTNYGSKSSPPGPDAFNPVAKTSSKSVHQRRSLPSHSARNKQDETRSIARSTESSENTANNKQHPGDNSFTSMKKQPLNIRDLWLGDETSGENNSFTKQEDLTMYTYYQQLKAKLEARQRKKRFELELKKINEDFENELLLLDNKIVNYHFIQFDDVEKSISHVLDKEQEHLAQLKERHNKRNQYTESNVQKIAAVKSQMILEQEYAIAEENARADLLKEISSCCKEGLADRSRLLDQIRSSKFAKEIPKDAMLKVREELIAFEKCLSSANINEKSKEDLVLCLQNIKSAAASLKVEVVKIESALKEAERLDVEVRKQAAAVIPTAAPAGVPVATPLASTVQVSSSSQAAVASDQGQAGSCSVTLGMFTSSHGMSSYEKAAAFMKLYQDALSEFITSSDAPKRQYRYQLLKAVNTPINAISDESPRHLMDKMQRLKTVLQGQAISVVGRQVSVRDHPEGLAIASDLIAKQIVQQGAQQVSSSYKSAFPVAAVALFMWAEYPDIGDLFLGHFYKRCPLLVPYYLPRLENQSKEEYFSLLGYEVNNGEIEEEEKYLKRLSGLVRLYAAIIQSPLPPSIAGRPHPHGLQFGWIWLSSMLNLQPRPTITATVLFDFLEVCGQAMLEQFKGQFQKLLQVLCQEFLPKIDAITPAGQSGPVSRLKDFLEKGIRSGRLPRPEGQLTPTWWRS